MKLLLDMVKAEQMMRDAGFEACSSHSYASGSKPGSLDGILAHDSCTVGFVDGVARSADGMEALAKRLLRLAALCRRIDAECRAPEVVVERQAARDVTLTWQPGPGAPLVAQRVVPGDPSTYPAEGELVPPHDTEGA